MVALQNNDHKSKTKCNQTGKTQDVGGLYHQAEQHSSSKLPVLPFGVFLSDTAFCHPFSQLCFHSAILAENTSQILTNIQLSSNPYPVILFY